MATAQSKVPYSRIAGHNAAVGTDSSNVVKPQQLHDKDISKELKPHLNNNHHSISTRPLFPWQGASALLSIVLLTAAAVSVLLASSGSPIERWKIRNVNIQPQVWLSVLSTISDGLTMFALAKAAEKTFWTAVARGTTLRNMYDLYESQSFIGALVNLAYGRGNKLAVVSVLCVVSALRGPLFQRASVVVSNALLNTSGVLTLHVAQLIPPYFMYQDGIATSTRYDEVYDSYIQQTPIQVDVDREVCGDVCNGKVKGYGFDIQCSNLTTILWDTLPGYSNLSTQAPIFNSSAHLPGVAYYKEYNPIHDTKEFIEAEQQGWFEVVNMFKTEPVCGDSISLRTCKLHHAVVEYEVSIQDGTISLSQDDWQHDTMLFHTPTWSFKDYSKESWGPTKQWVSWYRAQFNQEATILPKYGGPGRYDAIDSRFLLAKRFINDGDISNPQCNTTFRDPTQFVLTRLREMAFRTAVAAAMAKQNDLFGNPDLAEKINHPLVLNWTQQIPLTLNWTQEIAVTGQRSVVAFSVSILYLGCAISCSLLAVIAISLLFWGSTASTLPTHTFNPLDVARLFDSPLLRDAHEKDIEEYVRKEHGGQRVRYTMTEAVNNEDTMALGIILEDRQLMS